jgi:hypothetical protein
MSWRDDTDRAFDRRRDELLADASRHRTRCARNLESAAGACVRDHPALSLLSAAALGAGVALAGPPVVRTIGTVAGALTRSAGAGLRWIARSLWFATTRGSSVNPPAS